MSKKLVVLGAGWLGNALSQEAKLAGWQVEATRRTADSQAQICAFDLTDSGLHHTLTLTDAYWVCAIPPRMRQANSNYLETLKHALATAQSMACKGFILCSSTAVYDTADGVYTEQGTLAEQDSKRQQVLQGAEELVKGTGGKIVRLAGLVGPEREPGRFISGKQLSSSSQAKVNMLHQQDAVNGLICLIENWPHAQGIYNLCHPDHPTKQDYYQKHCENYESTPPTFNSDTQSERIIEGSAICQLGFKYNHDI
ncbi:NADP-binding protein [Pseudoalteromonas luteoviolacea]|uniref:NADP-binding protein n=1 Tax=Pseudoalteromonas luteoviolacea TaxID=43657 RepID=A0A1C0TLK7_9GAMM|nr:NADP-binding protein [Pseudoalteromonas luteoviolacea]OCQ19743.1 NADP-binding protein [Pseudoalteromonas luteoviolacea]